MTPEERVELENEIKNMTPEQRKRMVASLCGAVDELAQSIVANADAIWSAHQPKE